MPGLGGLETCRRLKAVPVVRDIPLLMMTSLENRDAMVDGLSAGADDFVPKSSDLTVLAARVRAQLRRKQFEDENRRFREELLRRDVEAAEARAARELAEARAALVEEIEHARQQAEQGSQFKSQFLANMSHELRTPLNAIIGFSEILAAEDAGPLNDDQKDFILTVLDSARYLLNLISEILDLSKIEAGRLQLFREWVELGQVCTSVREMIWPLAAKHDVKLEWDIQPELPAIHADPVRLKEILSNLLSNAVKFTFPGGTARLRATAEGGRLVLAVSDTGIGIRPEDLSPACSESSSACTPMPAPGRKAPASAWCSPSV